MPPSVSCPGPGPPLIPNPRAPFAFRSTWNECPVSLVPWSEYAATLRDSAPCLLLPSFRQILRRRPLRRPRHVLPDASLDIAETVRFTFRGGAFTYVSRDIPKRQVDRIFDVAAYMDGAPAVVSIDETGRRVRVHWRFRAASESTHVFTLSYRVEGAIRDESGRALLHWRAIPEDRDYRILAASIAIDYPAGDLASPPEVPTALSVLREPTRGVFTLDGLPPRGGSGGGSSSAG
jgi:hypothetical protein